jgi:hypothetical protein
MMYDGKKKMTGDHLGGLKDAIKDFNSDIKRDRQSSISTMLDLEL